MKLFKLIVIVLCTGFLNVGCTSTESPEQLIKKPIHNEQEANLYKSINATLGKGSSILLPKNSSEVATINTVDLDNNGSDEIVVFQKQENFNEVNNKVGFSVLLNNGKNIIDSHLVDGDSIEYANFFDLDNDGYKEIILLSKKDNKTIMEVYKFKENKIIRLTKFDPSWIENKDDFTEMKVKIKNLDNDGKLDIIIANFNPKTHVMTVSLAYFDQYVKLRDFSVFNDVKNLDSAYLDIKKVSKDKKGIIVDTKSFTENDSYITQILYLENDNLKKAFDEKNIKVTKPYYIPVEDINNDGIAEIPMINGNSRGYNQKSSLNISWNIWNGKTKESSNLVL
ncbi:description family protein [[Clostridium] sordellii ATCC 9714]|nr:description family protein [[Clostridium] sordellii ATCC 9714] [Paeniclostridium sordellii ATCC 9714]